MTRVDVRLPLAILVTVIGTVAHAQAPIEGSGGRTRAQLDTQARRAEGLHRTEEAFRLRRRLTEGDLAEGDRVIIAYDGPGLQRTDTLVVQVGRALRLSEPMGDLRVRGLLRNEVADSISARVARYFRNNTVHVTPLLRVSVTGAVRAPGFYYVRSDMPLSDVIMRTAGQDQSSDVGNVTIRRGAQTLWSPDDVQTALREGLTVEELTLEPGDEISVGTHSDWKPKALQYGLPILTAIVFQLLLRR